MLHREDLLHMIGNHTEDELRTMLCEWIDCASVTPSSSSSSSSSSSPSPVVTLKGKVANDGFYFDVPVSGASNGTTMHLDTGAFEMLLTKTVADALKLPNDGPLNVSGVTGSSNAYKSHVTLDFGSGQVYKDVPCVVDPSFTGTSLFGFRFFIDNQLAVQVNPVAQTVEFIPTTKG